MASSTIHRPWNSVDIRGADGLLYHGRVIDCVEEGLVVDDLGCETPRMVPFGQIYCFYPECHPVQVTERMPVDALMRLQLTEPARWYPAIFLAGEFGCLGSFGLVLVTTPEGTTMEVLPADRIQEHAEQAIRFLVRKTDLVKENVTLPRWVSSGTPSPGLYKTSPADQHLVDCFNSSNSGTKVLATHIDGRILHVLKGADRFAMDYRSFDRQLKGGTLLRMLGVKRGEYFGGKRRRQENTDTVTMSMLDTFETMERQPFSNYLPVELLAELFTYLDGLEQVRLRVVCSKWNDILTAFPVTRTLCVGVPEGQRGESIVRIKSLCKQWTGRTKIIINTYTNAMVKDVASYHRHQENDYEPLLCSGRLFRCIMQERQLSQLESVILANVTWNWKRPVPKQDLHFSCFINHIREELNSFASVCHSLVLKNVTVELLEYGLVMLHRDVALTVATPVTVYISKGRIVRELSMEDMWSMMEDSLPQLSTADLGHWLQLVQGADDILIEQLLQVLSGYQSADPRASNQLRNKQWTAEDLPAIVPSKLSRITLYKALKIRGNKPLIFKFRW